MAAENEKRTENRPENRDIRSLYPEELKTLAESMGEKGFRGAQLFSWLHGKKARSYEEMSNLPKNFRAQLEERWPLVHLQTVRRQVSALDGTEKYLFALPDGNVIESVRMVYHHGVTVCVSSQAGCRMGCRFCASTTAGLERSLEAWEILEQVWEIERTGGERVSHIVMMGSGEPLDNYDNAVRFIRLVSDPDGTGISQRNITLSTCGLVPKIRDLAGEKLTITLAISLHAPNDEKRRRLMPVAQTWTVRELMDACRYYFSCTGRRLTFEYALAAGENDSAADAEELAALLRGINGHVNLIPVNPVRESGLRGSGKKVTEAFQNKLEKYGIHVTIRREMGSDIDGACGQLRRRYMSEGDLPV